MRFSSKNSTTGRSYAPEPAIGTDTFHIDGAIVCTCMRFSAWLWPEHSPTSLTGCDAHTNSHASLVGL